MRTWLLLSLLWMSSLQAEVYKWSDDQGRVHYGDKPSDVPEAEAVGVDTRTSSGVALDDEGREEKRKRLLDAMAEDRKEKAEQREQARAKKAERQRQCQIAKDRLRRRQNASGVYNLDKEGNRVYLSNEEREQSTARLQLQVNKYCR